MRGLLGVSLVGTVACLGTTEPLGAEVRFRLESATCAGPIEFQLYIDGARVAAASLQADQVSNAFTVAAGTHQFRGAIEPGTFSHDTTMTLAAGASGTVILSPYCS